MSGTKKKLVYRQDADGVFRCVKTDSDVSEPSSKAGSPVSDSSNSSVDVPEVVLEKKKKPRKNVPNELREAPWMILDTSVEHPRVVQSHTPSDALLAPSEIFTTGSVRGKVPSRKSSYVAPNPPIMEVEEPPNQNPASPAVYTTNDVAEIVQKVVVGLQRKKSHSNPKRLEANPYPINDSMLPPSPVSPAEKVRRKKHNKQPTSLYQSCPAPDLHNQPIRQIASYPTAQTSALPIEDSAPYPLPIQDSTTIPTPPGTPPLLEEESPPKALLSSRVFPYHIMTRTKPSRSLDPTSFVLGILAAGLGYKFRMPLALVSLGLVGLAGVLLVLGTVAGTAFWYLGLLNVQNFVDVKQHFANLFRSEATPSEILSDYDSSEEEYEVDDSEEDDPAEELRRSLEETAAAHERVSTQIAEEPNYERAPIKEIKQRHGRDMDSKSKFEDSMIIPEIRESSESISRDTGREISRDNRDIYGQDRRIDRAYPQSYTPDRSKLHPGPIPPRRHSATRLSPNKPQTFDAKPKPITRSQTEPHMPYPSSNSGYHSNSSYRAKNLPSYPKEEQLPLIGLTYVPKAVSKERPPNGLSRSNTTQSHASSVLETRRNYNNFVNNTGGGGED